MNRTGTTITMRLQPTEEQAELIEKTLVCCSSLWNRMVSDEAKLQEELGKFYIPAPARYKREMPELKAVDSYALGSIHQTLIRRYREHTINSHDNPKPAPVERMSEYTTYSQQTKSGQSVRLVGGQIKLPKLGWVHADTDFDLPEDAGIKSVRISSVEGEYFCRVQCSRPVS